MAAPSGMPEEEKELLRSSIQEALAFAGDGRVEDGYAHLDLSLAWAESLPMDPETGALGDPEPWRDELVQLYRRAIVRYAELFSPSTVELVERAGEWENADLRDVTYTLTSAARDLRQQSEQLHQRARTARAQSQELRARFRAGLRPAGPGD